MEKVAHGVCASDQCDSTRIHEEVSGDSSSENNIRREQRSANDGRIGEKVRGAQRHGLRRQPEIAEFTYDTFPKPIGQHYRKWRRRRWTTRKGSSGDLVGLKGERQNEEIDSTMDVVTRVDSGSTRQIIASRQQQCATTVDSVDIRQSRALKNR